MSELGALLAGIGAMISSIASIGLLWFSIRRGSNRENERSASVALEIAQDETVTPIDRGDAHER